MPDALQNAHLPEPANNNLTASDGRTITIHDDGSVEIGLPAPAIKRDRSKDHFDANLAEELGDGPLAQIAYDYLDGVAADILSRSQFIANYNKGIDLLGLKIEESSGSRGSRQSISRIKSNALLKACVRSQSMARGSLLPANGPCKVQTISGETSAEDDQARNFEQDFNYYLTDVDRTYYPDMDRALFYRAFGGSVYKKIYRDPILQRPVSRSLYLDSLIISEDATDLYEALRKTHELLYSPVEIKRMQVKGGWRDVTLGSAQTNDSLARRKIMESQGLAAISTRMQDVSRTIYEGYWSIDPKDYGFDEPSAPEGLPLPYRVVIDKDSQQVLALHRNWKKGDEEFKERKVFVKYGLVPGLGFLDYGFLHLIGNQTRVLTAIWQILVDKGMLSNFPGGLKAKGVRTATNEINPALGEWVEVDLGATDDIRKALMAMPYGEISAVFIQLMEAIQQDVESLSGTLEIAPGDTSANTPVGTIMAMIEQQSQDLTAVHQRDHRSQQEELQLLRDLFVENPADLRWLKRKGSERNWADMVEEFSDMDLVPASDPNIPSQTHRIMLNSFILDLAQKGPMLFGPAGLRKVAKRVMTSVGINDAEDLLDTPQNIAAAMQPQQQGGGAGAGAAAKAQAEAPIKQAELQIEQQKLSQEEEVNQRQAANEAADTQERTAARQDKTALDAAELQLAQEKLQAETAHDAATLAGENQMDPLDRANLDKAKAQTFSAMGMGAQGFAKANETVQQGVHDLYDFENGTENGQLPAPPQPVAPLQPAASKRKKTTPKEPQ